MLQLTDVTKAYGERRAVDGVSFAVPSGSPTGFVGANGAAARPQPRPVLSRR